MFTTVLLMSLLSAQVDEELVPHQEAGAREVTPAPSAPALSVEDAQPMPTESAQPVDNTEGMPQLNVRAMLAFSGLTLVAGGAVMGVIFVLTSVVNFILWSRGLSSPELEQSTLEARLVTTPLLMVASLFVLAATWGVATGAAFCVMVMKRWSPQRAGLTLGTVLAATLFMAAVTVLAIPLHLVATVMLAFALFSPAGAAFGFPAYAIAGTAAGLVMGGSLLVGTVAPVLAASVAGGVLGMLALQQE